MNLAYAGFENYLQKREYEPFYLAIRLLVKLKSLYKVNVMRGFPITPTWISFVEKNITDGTND